MVTMKQVLTEFLREQKARLKPRTYRGYVDAIEFFEDYLDGYAYQYLDEENNQLLDKLSEGDKQYCEIFGPDKLGACEFGEFLNDFMIRKVMGSKELMKTVGTVMRILLKWMKEKGYISRETYEDAAETVDELKDELPKVEELSDLIFDYIENSPPERDFTETVEGYFRVTRIEPGELGLEDIMEGREIGPVLVSNLISSMCKVGWVICLELGKTSKGWLMLGSGNVYPR
ncbi:MAG: hypothetical protein ACUVXA_15380 [Candidatus Jordarchaeum sp.]|uniref:hypothetical protein n=1 Tax=Candidatus Jordarchaeum sp. TaxID=2823881 RepID=UPI00404A8586